MIDLPICIPAGRPWALQSKGEGISNLLKLWFSRFSTLAKGVFLVCLTCGEISITKVQKKRLFWICLIFNIPDSPTCLSMVFWSSLFAYLKEASLSLSRKDQPERKIGHHAHDFSLHLIYLPHSLEERASTLHIGGEDFPLEGFTTFSPVAD